MKFWYCINTILISYWKKSFNQSWKENQVSYETIFLSHVSQDRGASLHCMDDSLLTHTTVIPLVCITNILWHMLSFIFSGNGYCCTKALSQNPCAKRLITNILSEGGRLWWSCWEGHWALQRIDRRWWYDFAFLKEPRKNTAFIDESTTRSE